MVERKRGERMERQPGAVAAGLILVVLALSGCAQPGPDPQAEAQQKVEADAMMQQYATPSPPPQQ